MDGLSLKEREKKKWKERKRRKRKKEREEGKREREEERGERQRPKMGIGPPLCPPMVGIHQGLDELGETGDRDE